MKVAITTRAVSPPVQWCVSQLTSGKKLAGTEFLEQVVGACLQEEDVDSFVFWPTREVTSDSVDTLGEGPWGGQSHTHAQTCSHTHPHPPTQPHMPLICNTHVRAERHYSTG